MKLRRQSVKFPGEKNKHITSIAGQLHHTSNPPSVLQVAHGDGGVCLRARLGSGME